MGKFVRRKGKGKIISKIKKSKTNTEKFKKTNKPFPQLKKIKLTPATLTQQHSGISKPPKTKKGCER